MFHCQFWHKQPVNIYSWQLESDSIHKQNWIRGKLYGSNLRGIKYQINTALLRLWVWSIRGFAFNKHQNNPVRVWYIHCWCLKIIFGLTTCFWTLNSPKYQSSQNFMPSTWRMRSHLFLIQHVQSVNAFIGKFDFQKRRFLVSVG